MDQVVNVDREADGTRLVGDGTGHGLPDPPAGVGGEPASFVGVEFVDRFEEAQVAFLDQVREGKTRAPIAFGQRDDQSEVGLGQLFSRRLISGLNALTEFDLFVGREKFPTG